MAAPERSCRVCRVKRPKAELLRFVARADGLQADARQRLTGRGYYCCPQHAGRLGQTIKRGK